MNSNLYHPGINQNNTKLYKSRSYGKIRVVLSFCRKINKINAILLYLIIKYQISMYYLIKYTIEYKV